MRNTIDNRILDSIPLIERIMEFSDNELFIIYTVVGDLDFDITLRKKYSSYDELERSVILFLSNEKKNINDVLIWNDDFPIKQEKAKKNYFLGLIMASYHYQITGKDLFLMVILII